MTRLHKSLHILVTCRARSVLIAMASTVISSSVAVASDFGIGGFIGDHRPLSPDGFTEPTDVAVYDGRTTGHNDDKILVIDYNGSRGRVQRLDSNGNVERSWGRGSLGDPRALAVNSGTGAIYVLDARYRRVVQYGLNGKKIRSWNVALNGAERSFRRAALAVSPASSADVFVGDVAHNRVLQFGGEGSFRRAWGYGVATGAGHFEVCVVATTCRTGLPVSGGPGPTPAWPNHVAVDRDGVLYGSAFFGDVFYERPPSRTRIVRFEPDTPLDGTDAREALLPPLVPNPSRYASPQHPEEVLTDGATLGLEVDPRTDRLLVLNNPFGPTKLDLVRNPGANATAEGRPIAETVSLPFLQNVNEMAITANSEAILIATGVRRQLAGTSSYTGCRSDDAERDCHGLIVLAPPGVPGAIPAAPLSDQGPAALINPHGVVRYRFQVSADGARWRTLGNARYVLGGSYEYAAPTRGTIAPGTLYAVRVELERRSEQHTEFTRRHVGFFLSEPPR